ncbi:LOW QUALITY PROTEIN: putative uncharacterized protein OBSCN-AS1 [Plecturocebus cupreus]
MYTASSSAETLRTVSRRSVPSSSMPYLALAHSRVSSLNHAASVDGWGTSHRNVADSFSRTARSCSRFLKGTAGSAERSGHGRGAGRDAGLGWERSPELAEVRVWEGVGDGAEGRESGKGRVQVEEWGGERRPRGWGTGRGSSPASPAVRAPGTDTCNSGFHDPTDASGNGSDRKGERTQAQGLGRAPGPRAPTRELTAHDDQHGAVGLPHEVGRRAGVEAAVRLLAEEDLEHEVLLSVLVHHVAPALGHQLAVLLPHRLGLGLAGHVAAEARVLAFGHRAGARAGAGRRGGGALGTHGFAPPLQVRQERGRGGPRRAGCVRGIQVHHERSRGAGGAQRVLRADLVPPSRGRAARMRSELASPSSSTRTRGPSGSPRRRPSLDQLTAGFGEPPTRQRNVASEPSRTRMDVGRSRKCGACSAHAASASTCRPTAAKASPMALRARHTYCPLSPSARSRIVRRYRSPSWATRKRAPAATGCWSFSQLTCGVGLPTIWQLSVASLPTDTTKALGRARKRGAPLNWG